MRDSDDAPVPVRDVLRDALGLIPNACVHTCRRCGQIFKVHNCIDIEACNRIEVTPYCSPQCGEVTT